ncbi:T3SS effector HopA1 family protein [Hymenobacter sp. M29]|uniref:T3SS effector HopA1 family protein n=1 Tax=Hymenobacter mellowenesis TaxID=3063995 RepID=A0ABT9ACQ8_9BACT|nr:T3SS effector HopA1 family protein [Hymenobacter sp. M29]MDO7847323.1 T3SS effector HopA1 family protein [Hymenobacter sp. M29]
MLPEMHPDFLTVIDAVRFEAPDHYRFRGQPRNVHNISVSIAGMPPKPLDAHYTKVVQVLESDIYANLYKNQQALPPAAPPPTHADFILAVSAANNGGGTWDDSWEFVGLAADQRAIVTNKQLNFWVPAADVRPRPGQPLRAGERCQVRVGKEIRNLNPHYYMAYGDEPMSKDRQGVLMRYYWSLLPAGVVPYMAGITTRLNAQGVPFRTKVLAKPTEYGAADAGVLYVEKQHRAAAEAAVLAVHEEVAAHLLPGVPLFTQALRPGLAYAEDPADGLSFGLSRARLVAQALAACATRGQDATADKLAAIAAAFRAAGFDPDHPYYHGGVPAAFTS